MPDADFWLERWALGQLGFHRDSVHPHLVDHAGWLAEPGDPVLVPLCGKSLDLRWLARRGHPTVGVELAATAIRAVIPDGDPQDAGSHRVFADGALELWQGDFFGIRTDRTFAGVWDRAALVAVDPEQRTAYAAQLRALAAPGGRILLSTLDYDPAVMGGPPFAVGPDVVPELFADAAVELVRDEDLVQAGEGVWRDRGHEWFTARLYRIELP